MGDTSAPGRRRARVRRADGIVLVTIAVTLAALIVPAVLKAREAASKSQCGSNLRQIAIACHNYHGDFHRLPPGYWGQYPTSGPFRWEYQNIGFLAALLPYLELDGGD